MHRRSFLGLSAPSGVSPTPSVTALAPFEAPLSRRQARHLVTRLEFGARLRRVNGFVGLTAQEIVDFVLDEAQQFALPEAPRWYRRQQEGDIEDLYGVQRSWMFRMREQGFIEKITLFWHNHLVTQYPVYGAPYHAYSYYRLLRTQALGNFKTMVHRIGTDPAMLLYLDGATNVRNTSEKGSNENYARELLELFTMGITGPDGSPNYSEADVRQLSRVLTGWTVDGFSARPVPGLHDDGAKTLFGRSFPGDRDPRVEYDRVIDLIFEVRGAQIAHFICRKLYVFFVDPVPDEGAVAALASTFLDADFELLPVFRQLFTSARFLDVEYSGARIKSPVDFLVGFLNETETTPTTEVLEYFRVQLEPARLSMELFNPPDVAGWPGLNPPDAAQKPGDESWITTGLLPERWTILTDLMNGAAGNGVFDPVQIAIRVSDPSNPFAIAEDLASSLMPVPLALTSLRMLDEPFAGDVDLPPPPEVLNDPTRSALSKLLLAGTPWYEWPSLQEAGDGELEGARFLLREFLGLLTRELPEYQLH
ncbi:MAG: DUF1800 domain-containing protein [Bacteroidota bacterium]